MTTVKFLNVGTVTEVSMDQILPMIQQQISDMVDMPAPKDAVSMLRFEEMIFHAALRIADLILVYFLIRYHLDAAFCRQAALNARRRLYQERGTTSLKAKGRPSRRLQLRGGLEIEIKTPCLVPTSLSLGADRRENDVGSLPVFEALGISQGVTPSTRSEISRQLVICSSYKEAEEQLKRTGLNLNHSTIVNVAVHTGQEALQIRDKAINNAIQEPLTEESLVRGQRVRLSLDGGRARTRYTHRGPGIVPGENGRRPFELSWREPRLVTIDVLDEEGDVDPQWLPIYEVSLGTADEVFHLLTGLLRLIGVHKAKELEVISDGADWIWERLEKLIIDIGIDRGKVTLALDFYHAVEHISDALKACKHLQKEERELLLEDMRRRMKEQDGPSNVIKELKSLAVGRRAKLVGKEIRYLEKHLEHMRYAALKAQKLPIGSGVVESAVRRILNLRFKSAAQCWLEEHLEPLLYLRALVKSGRWDSFMEALLENRYLLDKSGRFNGEIRVNPYEKAA